MHSAKSALPNLIKSCTIVDTVKKAKSVLDILFNPQVKNRFHAIDTETIGFDIKKKTPIRNAKIISSSIYVGEDVDFGSGPHIWIDNTNKEIMPVFKKYFEDREIKKIYHNFSFDYHVVSNCGIKTKGFAGDTMHMARLHDSDRLKYSLQSLSKAYLERDKVPFDEIFKDFIPKDKKIPDLLEIQKNDNTRSRWIEYCVYDTEATWNLFNYLSKRLKEMPWNNMVNIDKDQTRQGTMLDFYNQYYVPFALVLIDMEQYGIFIGNRKHIEMAEKMAVGDLNEPIKFFRTWATQYEPNAIFMNVFSPRQLQQLLFAPKKEGNDYDVNLPHAHQFSAPNVEKISFGDQKIPSKILKFEIHGLGMKPVIYTKKRAPSCSYDVIKKLAGDPVKKVYGEAYKHFDNSKDRINACMALYKLSKAQKIQSLLNSFIIPLQTYISDDGRIHCSLNLNTNTGRISSRTPNLQNQPSGKKDIYKIRKAFTAQKGNRLIVADYSQLELRVLAHMTNCSSMIETFKKGTDLHSWTAMQMFPYIEQDVKNGLVTFDDYNEKIPKLKDVYKEERRKAKIFNFSIIYGKTPKGLSKDFKIPEQECIEYLNLWYKKRPEIKQWQMDTIKSATFSTAVFTLMGRCRKIADINSKTFHKRNRASRMATNTPIQGGAADVMMAAMIKIFRHEKLRQLGWRMALQIHDEVILEGPENSTKEAIEIVKKCMKFPFEKPLLVDLEVSIKDADNWYEAK